MNEWMDESMNEPVFIEGLFQVMGLQRWAKVCEWGDGLIHTCLRCPGRREWRKRKSRKG
jgi:hypothetical protein